MPKQKFEHLIDNIKCTNISLQEDIVVIRANTNSMREAFGDSSSSLIEVETCLRSSLSTGLNSDVSSIDFKVGRRSSEVDLR